MGKVAIKKVWDNEPDSKKTVRDDTESEVESVDLLAQSALLEVMG